MISFHQVVGALPASLSPEGFYFLRKNPTDDYAECYIADDNGDPVKLGNTELIQSVIAQRVQTDVPANAVFTDTITQVVDALNSTNSAAALSANKGRELNDAIASILALLASDDVTLDDLQEIVDYIKVNRDDLANLSIANIAGLQAALDAITNGFGTAANLDVAASGDAAANEVVKGDDSRLGGSSSASALDWGAGTISNITDSASAVAYDFDTPNPIALGRIFDFSNGPSDYFWGEQYKITFDGQYGNLELESYQISTTWSNFRLRVSGHEAIYIDRTRTTLLKDTNAHTLEFGWSASSSNITVTTQGGVGATQNLDIRAGQPSSDVAAASISIKGGDASTGASGANQNGGDLKLEGGDPSGAGQKGNVLAIGFPTSDPLVADAIWNDNGTLKVSAG